MLIGDTLVRDQIKLSESVSHAKVLAATLLSIGDWQSSLSES